MGTFVCEGEAEADFVVVSMQDSLMLSSILVLARFPNMDETVAPT